VLVVAAEDPGGSVVATRIAEVVGMPPAIHNRVFDDNRVLMTTGF